MFPTMKLHSQLQTHHIRLRQRRPSNSRNRHKPDHLQDIYHHIWTRCNLKEEKIFWVLWSKIKNVVWKGSWLI